MRQSKDYHMPSYDDVLPVSKNRVNDKKQSPPAVIVKPKQNKPNVIQKDIMQTPIPRRRPPEPFSSRSRQSVTSTTIGNKPSSPRLSHKGLFFFQKNILFIKIYP